jgi:two-component system, NarL family, response regulator LiaR
VQHDILEHSTREEAELIQTSGVSLRQRIAQFKAEASSPSPVRVMIVDDSEMVRRGLVKMLATFGELEVVGEASQGQEAVALCRQQRPDVVLMDIHMPRLNGIEATRLIRAACPGTQVIALSVSDDQTVIQQSLQAGAISYLLKDATAVELCEAICRADRGQSTLVNKAIDVLVQMTARPTPSLFKAPLTRREWDILALMAEGLNNRVIAQRLRISPSTAKGHVSSILEKLQARSRSQAVALAVEHRLLEG